MRTAVIDARSKIFMRNMDFASLERALQLFRDAAQNRRVVLSPDLCREFVLVRVPAVQVKLQVHGLQNLGNVLGFTVITASGWQPGVTSWYRCCCTGWPSTIPRSQGSK